MMTVPFTIIALYAAGVVCDRVRAARRPAFVLAVLAAVVLAADRALTRWPRVAYAVGLASEDDL